MNRSETLRILAVLRVTYPQFYKNIGPTDADHAAKIWEKLFSTDDYRLVDAAVRSFIESDERGFPPSPGQIKAKIRLLVEPDRMTEMEAWSLVAKALRNSLYGAKEEFEQLPPVLKRIVHSPEQLQTWGKLDSDTVHSVIASNFQRSYRTITAKEQEFEKLPADVKALVESLRLERARMPELPATQETSAKREAPVETEGKEKYPLANLRERIEAIKRGAGYEAKEPEKPRKSREEVIALLRSKKPYAANQESAQKGAEHGTGIQAVAGRTGV